MTFCMFGIYGSIDRYMIPPPPPATALWQDCGKVRECFGEALPLLDEGMKKVRADQRYHRTLVLVGLVLLACTGALEVRDCYGVGLVPLCMEKLGVPSLPRV